jgi:flagellar biosynthesis chaperone FliJ
MEKQIESQNEEILMLISQLKLKDQQHQETKTKIDLLDKKVEVAKNHAEKISNLETEVTKLKDKERHFTEVIEQLQEDNMKIEQENAQFKKLTRRAGLASSPNTPRKDGSGGGGEMGSPGSAGGVNGVKAVLRHSHGMELQDSLELLMDGNIAAQVTLVLWISYLFRKFINMQLLV